MLLKNCGQWIVKQTLSALGVRNSACADLFCLLQYLNGKKLMTWRRCHYSDTIHLCYIGNITKIKVTSFLNSVTGSLIVAAFGKSKLTQSHSTTTSFTPHLRRLLQGWRGKWTQLINSLKGFNERNADNIRCHQNDLPNFTECPTMKQQFPHLLVVPISGTVVEMQSTTQ